MPSKTIRLYDSSEIRTIGPAVALRRRPQHVAQRAQLGLPVDPAGGVVRRVDDDRARPRRDRRGDGVDVEVERGLGEVDADGRCAGRGDHQLVEEPRWREVDHLVADVAQGPDRDAQRAERARRHRDVLGPIRDPGPPAERLGHHRARLLLAHLVREPVLVLRHGVALERVDQPRQRQLLWVAEREVGDPLVEVVPLPRPVLEPREHVRDAGDHPVRASLGVGHSRSSAAIPPSLVCSLSEHHRRRPPQRQTGPAEAYDPHDV